MGHIMSLCLKETNKKKRLRIPVYLVIPNPGVTPRVSNVSLIKTAMVPTMWGWESRVLAVFAVF